MERQREKERKREMEGETNRYIERGGKRAEREEKEGREGERRGGLPAADHVGGEASRAELLDRMLRRLCLLLVRHRRHKRHLQSQWKVDVRLPGKGNPNSHGARPVHLIITMIKWIWTSRLSIKNSP